MGGSRAIGVIFGSSLGGHWGERGGG